MIYKRAIAKLRAQDWFAILVELAIVILGVFIGTLVANANQQRLEGKETQHRLEQLKPELQRIVGRAALVRDYYAITRRYAEAAFAGWGNDPKVSDSAFVIAAYQASQVKAMSTTSQSWAELFGADQLRNIDDPAIRDPMLRLMTYPSENLGIVRMQTKYRDTVRSIIPDAMQQAIRQRCGDNFTTPSALDLTLHDRCDLKLDPASAKTVATDLRRHPELVEQLRLHLSTVASLLNDVFIYDTAARRLGQALDR